MTDHLKRIESLTSELDRLEDRLSLALEAGGIGVWEWNVKTNELWWDEQMLRLFGLDRKDFNGHYDDFIKCLMPEDAKMANRLLQESVQNRVPYDFKYTLKSREGVRIRGKGKCYRDVYGEPERFVGVCVEE